ncbi:hypothetical protein QTP88_014205 [Uroleucon formosanum]
MQMLNVQLIQFRLFTDRLMLKKKCLFQINNYLKFSYRELSKPMHLIICYKVKLEYSVNVRVYLSMIYLVTHSPLTIVSNI